MLSDDIERLPTELFVQRPGGRDTTRKWESGRDPDYALLEIADRTFSRVVLPAVRVPADPS
jgi:hypothetical protein